MDTLIFPVVIVSTIGVISGIVLAVASKFMAVEEDPTAGLLREELPGANCGACGFAGCDAYAGAMAENPGAVATNLCTPGGPSVAKKLAEILGVSGGDVEEKQAIVRCFGNEENTTYAMQYEGPMTCVACKQHFSGRGTCPSACLGFGDCVKVCNYDAIRVIDGVAIVDPENCVACGMCVKACPSLIITMVPKSSGIFVGCSNTQKGAVTRKNCKVGCIACKRCEKTCPTGAITVEDNLARIDPAKCTNCGACVHVCPTNSINPVMFFQVPAPVAAEKTAE